MGDDETSSNTSKKGDEAFAQRKAGINKDELNEHLREYINEWKKQRSKDEEELKRLKEKQMKRKEIRAEQERKLNQEKKLEEERLKKIEAEKRAELEEQKKKAMEEAEIKRSNFAILYSSHLCSSQAGDDGRPEGGWQEVLWSGDGRSQGDVQDQGAGQAQALN